MLSLGPAVLNALSLCHFGLYNPFPFRFTAIDLVSTSPQQPDVRDLLLVLGLLLRLLQPILVWSA